MIKDKNKMLKICQCEYCTCQCGGCIKYRLSHPKHPDISTKHISKNIKKIIK